MVLTDAGSLVCHALSLLLDIESWVSLGNVIGTGAMLCTETKPIKCKLFMTCRVQNRLLFIFLPLVAIIHLNNWKQNMLKDDTSN